VWSIIQTTITDSVGCAGDGDWCSTPCARVDDQVLEALERVTKPTLIETQHISQQCWDLVNASWLGESQTWPGCQVARVEVLLEFAASVTCMQPQLLVKLFVFNSSFEQCSRWHRLTTHSSSASCAVAQHAPSNPGLARSLGLGCATLGLQSLRPHNALQLNTDTGAGTCEILQ
jgi:hypothetical protein